MSEPFVCTTSEYHITKEQLFEIRALLEYNPGDLEAVILSAIHVPCLREFVMHGNDNLGWFISCCQMTMNVLGQTNKRDATREDCIKKLLDL